MGWGTIAVKIGAKVASKVFSKDKSSSTSTASNSPVLNIDNDFEDMRAPDIKDSPTPITSVNYNDIVNAWTNGIYTYGKKN